MDSSSTTRDRILDAADVLLHRLGPAKMGVVDVARSLGMSHANVYRHFASKAALRDAVVERWLHGVLTPLAAVAASDADPPDRLAAWLWALIYAKRRKVLDDPEMFATYHLMAGEAREVVERHVAGLRAQIAGIIRAGIDRGAFAERDAQVAAGAVLNATLPFHHPHFLRDPTMRAGDAEAAAAIELLLAGLAKPAAPGARRAG